MYNITTVDIPQNPTQPNQAGLQTLGEAVCISYCIDTPGKGINLTFLPPVINEL